MKLVCVSMVMAVVAAGFTPTTTARFTRAWTTRGPDGLNLIGKMFTLSRNRGGISFYPSYLSPSSTPWRYTSVYPTPRYRTTTTRPTTTTRRTTRTPHRTTNHHPWTTTTTPRAARTTLKPTTHHPWTTTTTPRAARTTLKPTTHHPWTITTTPRAARTTLKPTTHHPWTTTTTPRAARTTLKPTTHHPWTTTTTTRQTTRIAPRPTTHYPWTTAPPTRGVSVCLRYLTDYVQDSSPMIFALGPSSRPLRLMSNSGLSYGLSFTPYSYPNLFLQPKIRFWSNIGPDIWTRLCLTVDSMKNVAQVFSGGSISIRKFLPERYVWSGEPVIDFSGFDGQVTDVQIWDYPLSYREIYNYMVSGIYGPHHGSVLTWSSISYSLRGNVVMEDVYEQQAKQSLSGSGRGRGRHLKRKKKNGKFWNLEEKKARKRQQI